MGLVRSFGGQKADDLTPTARTLEHLRNLGCIAEVVEKRIPRTHITRDLFGCLDIVAIHPGVPGVLGVQVTTIDHQADRRAKVQAEPRARIWLEAGNRIAVMAWAKRGPRGQRKVWTLSETAITAADFPAGAPDAR